MVMRAVISGGAATTFTGLSIISGENSVSCRTAVDVVNRAFRKAGILGGGNALSSDDLSDGLTDLGDMLALWNEKKFLVWSAIDVSFPSDGRVTPYSIGPNASAPDVSFGNMMPTRIDAAYVRQHNTSGGIPVDTPLRIIQSLQQYSRLSLKAGLISFPQYIFLNTISAQGEDCQRGTGNIYIYPWPNAVLYEIHLILKLQYPINPMPQDLDFTWMPPPAIPAMVFNLAKWLRQAYGKGLRADPELNVLAGDALDTLRQAQVQVPELVMPRTLIGPPQQYNIFGDTFT